LQFHRYIFQEAQAAAYDGQGEEYDERPDWERIRQAIEYPTSIHQVSIALSKMLPATGKYFFEGIVSRDE
jgi:hypothetical protein